MERKTCRGCGKAVYFVADENGRTQILDAVAPVWVAVEGPGAPPRAVRLKEAYVSHFATCPAADQFSQKKNAGIRKVQPSLTDNPNDYRGTP